MKLLKIPHKIRLIDKYSFGREYRIMQERENPLTCKTVKKYSFQTFKNEFVMKLITIAPFMACLELYIFFCFFLTFRREGELCCVWDPSYISDIFDLIQYQTDYREITSTGDEIVQLKPHIV